MLFNSPMFLFVFLPLAYAGFWRLESKQQRYVWLTFTGYAFYSFWDARFCALMAFSTLVSYLAGRGLLAWKDPKRRKLCLVLPIVADLMLLGFFKYTNFAISSAHSIAGWCGQSFSFPELGIILPVGISFYTFHTISYIVDAYRGTIVPTRNFFEFSCYVSLFSQLVAGPIVRFRQIEGDLEKIDRADWRAGLNIGWSFFVIGLIKKVLIADTIALIIDPRLNEQVQLASGEAWLCMLGYTYQLYFDFSGYSDMAVGLGHLFGMKLPQNFDSPYKALNIADFWRRWHISLSSCLRDYLYIPFGGGRGSKLLVNRNLLLTMLIGGLWHGASWTFVIWGAYHGLLLVSYRQWGALWDRMPRLLQRAGTFVLVVVGWAFFRANNLDSAFHILGSMFSWNGLGAEAFPISLFMLLGIGALIIHLFPNTFEVKHSWGLLPSISLGALFVLCIIIVMGGDPSPFLYFQF